MRCCAAILLLLIAGLVTGCRSSRDVAAMPQPTAAAALAFAPPAFDRMPAMEREDLDAQLARYGRGPTALMGYDSPTVETYFLQVDDRQWFSSSTGGYGLGLYGYGYYGSTSGWYDSYQRRAITTRSFERVRPAGS